MGPGAGLDRCGKSRPTGIRSPDLPARSESLYRLRYPGSQDARYDLRIIGKKTILLNIRNKMGCLLLKKYVYIK
jgi:hypothetical protein